MVTDKPGIRAATAEDCAALEGLIAQLGYAAAAAETIRMARAAHPARSRRRARRRLSAFAPAPGR